MSRQASRSGRQTPVGGFGAKPRAARGFGAFGLSSSGSELSYLAEPPDFSAISDAQAVVSYKNLLKKDSVTKARALEELLSYVKAHPFEREGGPEEAIIEAWVSMPMPRKHHRINGVHVVWPPPFYADKIYRSRYTQPLPSTTHVVYVNWHSRFSMSL